MKFYTGTKWQKCRKSFIAERVAIDGGMCQDCGEKLGEIAHHWPIALTPRNIELADVSLNHRNLRWVCHECHDKYPGHGLNKPTTPQLMFDANGDPIPPPPPENETGAV